MTKEKIFLIIILAVVCLGSAVCINNKLSENRDMARYEKAIKLYQTEEYQEAYYQFSLVSGFSNLKQAALFRQARCATSVGDYQTAIRNYYILLKRFPNTPLYAISEYNLATLLFEKEEYNTAKRHFSHIIKTFPTTEVAIASKYYLGVLNNDSSLLLEYIKLSPNGRFAQDAIDTLTKLETPFTIADNLIIANSYLAREKYSESIEYYEKTNLPYSWTGYAKALYKTKQWTQAKNLTTKGLSVFTNFVEPKEIYDCIDCFLSLSNNKLETIKYLLSVNPKAKGADYLMYLMAKNSPSIHASMIYESLFSKFPNGQFSGEALYRTFYSKISRGKYDEAIKLGKIHLSRFSNTNSAPAVMFWMGKIYDRKGMSDLARTYYKGVLSKYPDSYYAIRANSKLNSDTLMFGKNELVEKPVLFPINNKAEADFAIKLARLGDYDFVQELHKNDEFVKSWIEYSKGNYTHSALIAREAMDKLETKPDFKDTRWRLVYPIHYYNYVKKFAGNENPIILLSIIKEESHFNPNATSCVGAGGLMQLMPTTANEIASGYGISNNLANPESNIHLGCLYYAKTKRALNNKDMSAIMAYNAGAGAVSKWKTAISHSDIDDFVEKIPYPETYDYIKKVMKAYWNYSNIY